MLNVFPWKVAVPGCLATLGLIHGLVGPIQIQSRNQAGLRAGKSIERLCAVPELGLTRSQLCIVWIDRPTFSARMREKVRSLKWRRKVVRDGPSR